MGEKIGTSVNLSRLTYHIYQHMYLLSGNNTANNIDKASEIIRSHNTGASSKLVLHGNLGSIKCYLAQIIAQYSGKYLNVRQIEKHNAYPGYVMLETADATLRDSNAIAFFLSNSQLRRDDDLSASCQVIQWMSYAQNHISPIVIGWVLPSLFGSSIPKNMKANMRLCKEDLLCTLKKMETVLHLRTYLVGERISLADIAVFITFLPMYEYVFDPNYRKQYVNVNRWFSTILNQPEVQRVVQTFTVYNYFEELRTHHS